jgi:hypothetical protein
VGASPGNDELAADFTCGSVFQPFREGPKQVSIKHKWSKSCVSVIPTSLTQPDGPIFQSA